MNSEQEYYISLIDRLRQLPVETEWLEYKMNNYEPELIGEYISALSNSATIISRIIKDTINAGFIKLSDENAAPKLRRYIPYWA